MALQLLQSQEYRINLLQSLYQSLLGRNALPGEITAGLTLFQNGATDEEVIAEIASSLEYYNRAGGTNAAFVNRVYQDLLGRAPNVGEQTTFTTFLNNNGNTANNRRTIVLQLAQSAEYRTRLVGGFYQKYLRRSGLANEINGWLNLMQNGATDEQVIAGLLSTDEYFQLAQALVTPTPVDTPVPLPTTSLGTPTPISTPAVGTPTPVSSVLSGVNAGGTNGTSGPAGGISGLPGRPLLPPVFQNPGAVAIVNAPAATPRSAGTAAATGNSPAMPALRPPSTGNAGLRASSS